MPEEKAILRSANSTLEQVAYMPDTVENAAPAVPTPSTNGEQSNIIVTAEGNLENNISDVPVNTEVPIPSAEVEENTSTFEMPNFDEPTQAVEQSHKPQPKYVSWKDAIKEVDRKEVLKELGLDDFDIEFSEYRKAGGDPYKYNEARSFDWNKVPDADVVKDDLGKMYPKLSKDKIQILFDSKYKQGELESDSEKEFGLILMEAEAANIRAKRIEEQQKFQFPKVEPKQQQPQLQPDNKEQIEQAQKLVQFYQTHESTKNLLESKRVAIDIGADKPFNFKVDNPQMLWDVLFKPEVSQKFGKTKTGEPDVQLNYELGLHMINPAQFKRDIYNAGVTAGMKKQFEKGLNAQIPNQQMPPAPNESERDAWKSRARTGTLA